MDTFYIVTNYQKDPEMTVAHEIREYLKSKGKTCYIQQKEVEDPQGRYRYTDAQHVSDEVECVLVLRGDGTLLQAARDLVDRSIPASRHQYGNTWLSCGDRPEKHFSSA